MPVDVTSRGEAAEFMTRILGAGSGLLAQEWVPGRREGVSLFVAGTRSSPPAGTSRTARVPRWGVPRWSGRASRRRPIRWTPQCA